MNFSPKRWSTLYYSKNQLTNCRRCKWAIGLTLGFIKFVWTKKQILYHFTIFPCRELLELINFQVHSTLSAQRNSFIAERIIHCSLCLSMELFELNPLMSWLGLWVAIYLYHLDIVNYCSNIPIVKSSQLIVSPHIWVRLYHSYITHIYYTVLSIKLPCVSMLQSIFFIWVCKQRTTSFVPIRGISER